MIEAATDSALFPPFSQNTAEASAYPSVKARKSANIGVFEIFKPAFEGLVHILDNGFKTMAVASPGLLAYRIFDFPKAFLAWPSGDPRKAISKKIKPGFGLGQIGDFSLAGMQTQTSFLNQLADQLQRRLCFSRTFAENHKVSSPGESHPQALSEPDVNLSAHPAPIIQPQAQPPSANGQRAGGRVSRFFPASILPCADGD